MSDKIIHADLEIGVIDLILLKKVINDHAPKGEAGRLTREEGIPWDEVEIIRLEFLNILKIDHLWMLTGLTKLSLSHNIIEKIEGLEALVNLKELDLSFNKITVIENLDTLTKIEILTLYGNSIRVLENLSSLEKLIIFSIGNNKIESIENVLYLRQFEDLRSINFAGNPCCKQVPNFREWVAAYLPNIIYNEYKMILIEEKEAAREKFATNIEQVIELEKIKYAERERLKAEAAEEALHAESFVEFLGTSALFDKMFEGDVDGQLLLSIPEQPELREKYEKYKQNFCDVTKRLFDVGQQMYLERQNEIQQFLKCVDAEKSRNQIQSQDIIEKFVDKKLILTEDMFRLYDMVEDDEAEPDTSDFERLMEDFHGGAKNTFNEFNTLLNDTWMQLMKCEITINAQLEEVNENFSIVITDMLNGFLELVSSHFTELRILEKEWMEESYELALNIMNQYNTGSSSQQLIQIDDEENTKVISKELEKLFNDKENVQQCCAGSHDFHNLQIDNREDRLVTRANEWLSNLVTNLARDEMIRDRAQVLEINKFLDSQKSEFNDLYDEPVPTVAAIAGEEATIKEESSEYDTTTADKEGKEIKEDDEDHEG